MITEKVNSKEAFKILKSLNYSDAEIDCIKDDEALRKVMLKEGYREGYNCWVWFDDVNSETDPIV